MPEEEEIIEYAEGDGITPTPSEQRRLQNNRNIENNEKNIRAAANTLKDMGVPYASPIAKGIDVADRATGGRSTRKLAKGLNRANKVLPKGRKMQQDLNNLGESGIPDAINNTSGQLNKNHLRNNRNNNNTNNNVSGFGNKTNGENNGSPTFTNQRTRSGFQNSQIRGDKNIIIKSPLPVKIAMYGLLFFIPLFALMLFVVLFGNEEIAGGGAGNFMFGQTCTKVTVMNTGCDANNDNCSNIYSGEVDFEKYIEGIVAAESNGINNEEYLKLIAIAARTYAFDNLNSSCTVQGNSSFLNYMDVEESSNSSQIKNAVEETKNYIIVEDSKLKDITYGYGNITNEDSTNYYISYGTNTLDEEKSQSIPKSWADKQSNFKSYLDNWENESNSKDDISLIGALYLITNSNYSYEEVIEYYCGSNSEITENIIVLGGANGFINPTRTINCTSAFGKRIHPVKQTENNHTGLDIGISGGEPVFAVKSGVVKVATKNVNAVNNCSYGYGNYVLIDHGDGTSTLYAHLKYGTIPDSISEGVEVSQGEQIGQVGSTGCSTGYHLHYEVRLNGTQVDPADYLDLTNATGTCKR